MSATVNNKIVTRDVAKAADLTDLVTKYKTLSAPFANRVIGKITADITCARPIRPASQRSATSSPTRSFAATTPPAPARRSRS